MGPNSLRAWPSFFEIILSFHLLFGKLQISKSSKGFLLLLLCVCFGLVWFGFGFGLGFSSKVKPRSSLNIFYQILWEAECKLISLAPQKLVSVLYTISFQVICYSFTNLCTHSLLHQTFSTCLLECARAQAGRPYP